MNTEKSLNSVSDESEDIVKEENAIQQNAEKEAHDEIAAEAFNVYQERQKNGTSGSQESDWVEAEKRIKEKTNKAEAQSAPQENQRIEAEDEAWAAAHIEAPFRETMRMPDLSPETKKTIEILSEEKADRKVESMRVAKAQLPEIVKNLKESRAKGDSGEAVMMRRAEKLYEDLKGEKLKDAADKKAKERAKDRKVEVLTPDEFRAKHKQDEINLAESRKRSAIATERFESLSPEDQAKYGKTEEERLQNFTVELDKKINAKIKELDDKKGIEISVNECYAMMDMGYKPEEIRVRGFWGKLFHGGNDLEVPCPRMQEIKGVKSCKTEDLVALANECGGKFSRATKFEGTASLEQTIMRGQRRWRGTKQQIARDILDETIGIKVESAKPEAAQKAVPAELVGEPKGEIIEAELTPQEKRKEELRTKIAELKEKDKQSPLSKTDKKILKLYEVNLKAFATIATQEYTKIRRLMASSRRASRLKLTAKELKDEDARLREQFGLEQLKKAA